MIKTEIVKGKLVDPYECANITNDDYTTYPVDTDGNVTQVDVIENGKLFKFITPANAKARMDKQMVDNLKVGDESELVEETPAENVPPTGEESTPSESTPSESTTGESTTGEAGKEPSTDESTTGEAGEAGEAETTEKEPTGGINASNSFD